jgi:Gpi18-like mannosyltransferase
MSMVRACLPVLVLLVAVPAYYVGLKVGIANADLDAFLSWFDQLKILGISGISGEYSIYPPPYLYLLWIASLASDWALDLTLIKTVSLAFTFATAGAIFATLRHFQESATNALIGATLFLLLPTILVNGVYWGQSDIVYSFFVVLCFLFTLRREPLLAAAAFGLALSFKAQAILFSPYLFYLLLAREMFLKELIIAPLVYLGMMIPAWIAGRPAPDLLLVYLQQVETFHLLSLNAPNLYTYVQDLWHPNYTSGVLLGLVLSLCVAGGIALAGLRLQRTPERKLLIATAAVILMPFVMPKMHERYFFLADIFAFLLAFVAQRGWRIALLVQLGSILAYSHFLWGIEFGPYVGAALMSIAVVYVLLMLGGAIRQDQTRIDYAQLAAAPFGKRK